MKIALLQAEKRNYLLLLLLASGVPIVNSLSQSSSQSTPSPPTPRTFSVFKPDGYLSQFVNNGQIKKRQRMLRELFTSSDVPSPDFPPGLMPVGRLDEMSEGLLLVTTDGTLSHRVNTGGLEKEYYCQVDGVMTEDARRRLQAGGVDISIRAGGGGDLWKTQACDVTILETEPDLPRRRKKVRDDRHGPTSWVSVTIREGKNRQVRRMTAAVGFPTLRLVRVRVGCLRLAGRPGEIRELTREEVAALNACLDSLA